MGLSKFLSSKTGKRLYNFCYRWGACLVILGAVFKIAHIPYDNLLLMIGLSTKVFIFFISEFDEPVREYRWERVSPLLDDKNANVNPDAGVTGTLVTEKCLQQLKRLESNTGRLSETYEAQIKDMTEHTRLLSDMNSEELKEEMEKMAAYIRLLSKRYSQMLNTMNVKTGK